MLDKIILLFLLLSLVFYIIDKFVFKHVEHMSINDSGLNKILAKHNIEIDKENRILKKCVDDKCYTKKYETNHFNSRESHFLAKNKPKSNTIFKENNIPVPKHHIINTKNKFYYLNDFNPVYPCVLKPVDGMQGKDVNTFIKTKEHYNKILIDLFKKYDSVMYEEQVYGNNYRIFVFNDKVIDVIERQQPFIIGDGSKSVGQLIDEKNEAQVKKRLFATKNISWDYILEEGYKKDSILENGTKLFITNTINFHNGANPVRIKLENIPQMNINMFIKAHKLIGLECSGIDYMSNDITVPYNQNDGHIIEINDMVDTQIHYDADNRSKPYELFENIAKTFY